MIPALLTGFTTGLACFGLGATALRLRRIDDLTSGQWVSIALGLGFGIMTVALFWAGIADLLWRPVFAALLLAGIAGAARSLIARPPPVRTTSNRSDRPLALFAWALLGLSALCAAANLVGALAPPNFIDALVYHLHVPKQYLLHHGIVQLSGIWQHYQPMAFELLYMVPLAFGSVTGASLLCAGMGGLAAMATYLLGARLAGPIVGLLAAAFYYDNAMVAWESTSCFVDLGVSALSALGVLTLLIWRDDRRPATLMVAALLLGFASSCKLNAASIVIVSAGVVFVLSRRAGDSPRIAILRTAYFSILASLPVIPWFIRSWYLTGNPLYPFATPVFGNNPDRAAIDWVFAHYGVGYSLSDRLLAPVRLFTQGAAFENGHFLSPVPVLMAPIVLLRVWKERGQRALLLAVIGGLFVFWSVGAHEARYVLQMEPMMCALAADALAWLTSFGGRRRVIAVVTGGLFLAFGTLGTILYDKQFISVVVGRESPTAYLERTTWYYDDFQEICSGLPPGSRILTNAQRPTFYLGCSQARISDYQFDDPTQLRRLISDGHFTNILLLGNEGLERKLTALSPMVELIWHREEDVLVSRTFGGTAKQSVAWYRIKPGR